MTQKEKGFAGLYPHSVQYHEASLLRLVFFYCLITWAMPQFLPTNPTLTPAFSFSLLLHHSKFSPNCKSFAHSVPIPRGAPFFLYSKGWLLSLIWISTPVTHSQKGPSNTVQSQMTSTPLQLLSIPFSQGTFYYGSWFSRIICSVLRDHHGKVCYLISCSPRCIQYVCYSIRVIRYRINDWMDSLMMNG